MTSEQSQAVAIERQLGYDKGYEDGREAGARDGGSENGPHRNLKLHYVQGRKWVRPKGGIYWEQIPVHRTERCDLLATLDTPYSEGYVDGFERGYKIGVLDAYKWDR